MPKTAPERLRSQPLIDPRDTFDWSVPNLNVTARPTDPMVYSPPPASGASRVLKSLGLLTEEVGKVKDIKNQEDYELGQLAALKGEEVATKSWAALKGYDTLNGSLAALTDYQKDVDIFLAENPELTDEELEQGLNTISSKYLQGASDDFLKGFMEPALSIEQQASKVHTKRTIEQMRTQAFTKINTQVQESVKLELNKILDQYNVSISTLLDNPEAYQQLKDDNILSELGDTLRNNLTILQANSGVVGITKSEISAIYVDQVGQLAVELGLPELLDFAFVPDESKVSLDKTELQGAVYKYKDDANRVAQGFKTAIENAQKEAEKARLANMEYTSAVVISNARLAGVNDIATTKELEAQRRAIIDDPAYLATDKGQEKLAKIDELLLRKPEDPPQWLEESVRSTKIQLMRAMAYGELTIEEVENVADDLSESDYTMFMNAAKTLREAKEKAAQAETKEETVWDESWHFRSTFNTLVNAKKETFTKFDSGIIPLPEAQDDFVEDVYMELYRFTQKNNRWPEPEEANKMINDVYAVIREAYTIDLETEEEEPSDVDYSNYPKAKAGAVRTVKNWFGKDLDRTPDGRAMPTGTFELMSAHKDTPKKPELPKEIIPNIEQALKFGYTQEDIINYLIQQGFDEETVRAYFKENGGE